MKISRLDLPLRTLWHNRQSWLILYPRMSVYTLARIYYMWVYVGTCIWYIRIDGHVMMGKWAHPLSLSNLIIPVWYECHFRFGNCVPLYLRFAFASKLCEKIYEILLFTSFLLESIGWYMLGDVLEIPNRWKFESFYYLDQINILLICGNLLSSK